MIKAYSLTEKQESLNSSSMVQFHGRPSNIKEQ